MTDQPIIDMRNRPTFLHPFFGAEPDTPSYEVVRWLNRRVGTRDPEHFTRTPDPASYLREIEQAGITHAVMVGRSTPTVRISNDVLADLARGSDGRLIGVASVDPLDLGREAAVAEARRAVRERGLRAVNIDAGFYATPMRADDDRLLPLYEACADLGVPAPTATWGGMLDGSLQYYRVAWWYLLFPGLALLITTLAFNIFGDGVRDAFDPRTDRLFAAETTTGVEAEK